MAGALTYRHPVGGVSGGPRPPLTDKTEASPLGFGGCQDLWPLFSCVTMKPKGPSCHTGQTPRSSASERHAVRHENMSREQQIQTLGSLYLLYKAHSAQLQAAGYTKMEAFWLNFACVPFLPWARHSENRITLTQVLRLYLGIYLHNANGVIEPQAIPAFLELLMDRFRMAREAVSISDVSQLEMELGRFALPGEHDTARRVRAASIVLATIAEWQKQTGQDRLPCMLVEDVDDVTAV